MDLRFHDPDRTAERLRGGDCFVGGGGNPALGHGNAEFAENVFGLVFVQVHRFGRWWLNEPRIL
jgi:hypothetical protein